MVTLRQIYSAIDSLECTGDKDVVLGQLLCAIGALENALKGMDNLHVAGRNSVDTLLGCMMAVDSITGGQNDG